MKHVLTMDESFNINIIPDPTPYHTFYPDIANHVLCEKTGKIMIYIGLLKTKHREIWTKSCGNEFGRLMSGVGDRMKTGTNTMFPVKKHIVPRERKVNYMK